MTSSRPAQWIAEDGESRARGGGGGSGGGTSGCVTWMKLQQGAPAVLVQCGVTFIQSRVWHIVDAKAGSLKQMNA